MTCPTDSMLERLLADELPTRDAEPIRAHVVACPDCQSRLDRLTDAPALGQAAPASAMDISPLLDRLRQLFASDLPAKSQPITEKKQPKSSHLARVLIALAALVILGAAIAKMIQWQRQQRDQEARNAAVQAVADLRRARESIDELLAKPGPADRAVVEKLQATLEQVPNDAATGPDAARLAFGFGLLAIRDGDKTNAVPWLKRAQSQYRNLGDADGERLCLESLAEIQPQEGAAGLVEFWQARVDERPDDGRRRRRLAAACGKLAERSSDRDAACKALARAVAEWEELDRREPTSPFIRSELAEARRRLQAAEAAKNGT